MRRGLIALVLALLIAPAARAAESLPPAFDAIETIVVIYAENRSFVNILPRFPGATGIVDAPESAIKQRDRDGSVLPHLPPVWKEKSAVADPAYPESMPNAPFVINAPPYNHPRAVLTANPTHRFYQNRMQINGGRNDGFVAWTDAGSIVMGHYNPERSYLFQFATAYTIADHFFAAAYGGSALNHFWLACACSPYFADAPKRRVAVLDDDGNLALAPDSPKSALDGPPKWVNDGDVSPDGYVINTVQPAYQPSGIAPAPGGDPRYAEPAKGPLPPQSELTLGDMLNLKDIDWAWYAQGWDLANRDRSVIYDLGGPVNFQPHHQPYNYFEAYAPGTAAREAHLKDLKAFWKAAAAGTLPAVVFVKPDGVNNQHPGESTVAAGDLMIGTLVDTLRLSPQWDKMAIIITHDEYGGFWDPVPPPAGDRWGPGTRIPTVIVSPFAKKGFIDDTPYDTTSILSFISKRFDLDPLPGIRRNMGDLTNAFAFGK
jgi:acid phosphatase